MLSYKHIAVMLSLLGAASASPFVTRGAQACKPNFQGPNLLPSNQAFPAWTGPAYRVEMSGQFPDSFLIKLTSNQDTVVAASAQTAGSSLTVVPINFSSADPLQIWDIRCDVCGDPKPSVKFTTGCTISLRASPTLCIQVGAADVTVETCDSAQLSQKFDFQTA